MSMDNGIYILKLRSSSEKEYEYRVREIFAVGNIFKDMKVLYNAFAECYAYDNFHDAKQAAVELDEMTEYEIRVIDHYSGMTWAGIAQLVQPDEAKIEELV